MTMGNEPNLQGEGAVAPAQVARAFNGRPGADFISLMRSDRWGGPACRVAVPAVAPYGSDVPVRVEKLSPWAAYATVLYQTIWDDLPPREQPSDVLLHVYSRVGDGGPSRAAEPWTDASESHGYGWSSGQLLEEWASALGQWPQASLLGQWPLSSAPNVWITEYNAFADKMLPDAAYPDGILTAMRDRAVNILGARFGGLLWFYGPAEEPWVAYSLATQTQAAAELTHLTGGPHH